MNRLGLGLLALLLLGGVAALFFTLSGDGDAASPRAVRPGDTRGGGAVSPRGTSELTDAPAAGDPALGLGAAAEPERSVARPTPPAGLARNTRQFLSGRVVAASQPMQGAQVQYATRDGEALDEAATDANGSFSLDAPYPLEDGMILIRARGYTPLLTGPHSIRAGERRFVGNLMLTQGVALAGQVTDPSGAPIEGARVEARQGAGGGGMNRHVLVATTDRAGMFRLPEAPLGAVSLAAHATGYGSQSVDMDHRGATERVAIALARERSLVVRVVGARGAPVAGANVHLRPHAPESPAATATTDDSGIAQIAGLGSETWELRVDAAGYRTAARDRVKAPGEVTIDLEAWPCIRGRVALPNGDPPPAGTSVKSLTADARGAYVDAGTTRPVPVDAEGAFELCDLRPGVYVVQADAPGWAPTRSEAQRLTLGRDAEDVRVELTPGAGVDVLVQAGTAQLPGARCELWTRTPPPTELWRTAATPVARIEGAMFTATTDSQGHALFRNVAEGQYWCLVRKEGLLPTVHGPVSVGRAGTVRVGPLRLEQGGQLQGTLVGLPDDAGETMVNLFGQHGVTQNAPVLVLAAADGTWTSPLLPPGRYRLTARVVAGTPPRAYTAGTEETVERGAVTAVELELQ